MWTIGERKIEVNEETMQFTSSTPWLSSEIDALHLLWSVRSIERITANCIAVYPTLPGKVKDMAIAGVKAIAMIHTENVVPGLDITTTI